MGRTIRSASSLQGCPCLSSDLRLRRRRFGSLPVDNQRKLCELTKLRPDCDICIRGGRVGGHGKRWDAAKRHQTIHAHVLARPFLFIRRSGRGAFHAHLITWTVDHRSDLGARRGIGCRLYEEPAGDQDESKGTQNMHYPFLCARPDSDKSLCIILLKFNIFGGLLRSMRSANIQSRYR